MLILWLFFEPYLLETHTQVFTGKTIGWLKFNCKNTSAKNEQMGDKLRLGKYG